LRLRAIRYQNQHETDVVIEESSNELRAILNPKQQKKFEDLMKRFRGGWRADSSSAEPTPIPDKAAPTPTPQPPLEAPAPP